MASLDVSVVVPVRNGERTIARCLESLLQQDYPATQREIIVVDNASEDRTAAIIRQYPVTCVQERQIRNPAGARNRGIQAARGEVVAFTDADCVAVTHWLAASMEGFSSDRTGCVAGEIRSADPRTMAQLYAKRRGLFSQHHSLTASAKPYAQTANVAYRRWVLDRLGGFDPALAVGEDADLSGAPAAAGAYGTAGQTHTRNQPAASGDP